MNKDKSLKATEQKLILLMVGNNETGKRTLCKEIMRKYQSANEENKTFYIAYSFIYQETIDDCKLAIPIEIRVINGDEIDTDLKINSSFYKKAYGAFVVTAINDFLSFQDGSKWKEKVDIMCCLPNKFPLPIFLLINKCDQIDRVRRSPWMEKSQLDNYLMENQYFNNFFVSNVTDIPEITREQILSNDSNEIVDFEIPLKSMIQTLFQFKDLKEKFIHMTSIQISKIRENKIQSDSSSNNASSVYDDVRVVDRRRTNTKNGKCLIL